MNKIVLILLLFTMLGYSQDPNVINSRSIDVDAYIRDKDTPDAAGRAGSDNGNSKSNGTGEKATSNSSLTIAQVNKELENTLDYYATYFNLSNYITTKTSTGLTIIDALETLQLFDEPVRRPIQPGSSASDLRLEPIKLDFVKDLKQHLNKTTDPTTNKLKAKVSKYERYLWNKERLRMANITLFGVYSLEAKNMIQLGIHGDIAFRNYFRDYDTGSYSPFNSRESIFATQILFYTYLQMAKELINPYTLQNAYLTSLGIDSQKFARILVKEAETILAFANGYVKGIKLSILETIDLVKTISNYTMNTLNDPKQMLKKAWEFITSINKEAIFISLFNNVSKTINTLDTGTPFEKGKVIGSFITDIFKNSVGGTLPYKKMSGYVKNEAESFLQGIKSILRNQDGVIGNTGLLNIIRNKVPKDIDNISFPDSNLRAKLEDHGDVFGITNLKSSSRENLNAFRDKMVEHIKDKNTISFKGTFQDVLPKEVIHYFNNDTDINVFFNRKKEFWSVWKVTKEQKKSLLRHLHLPNLPKE